MAIVLSVPQTATHHDGKNENQHHAKERDSNQKSGYQFGFGNVQRSHLLLQHGELLLDCCVCFFVVRLFDGIEVRSALCKSYNTKKKQKIDIFHFLF
jgi:hypothetical protein